MYALSWKTCASPKLLVGGGGQGFPSIFGEGGGRGGVIWLWGIMVLHLLRCNFDEVFSWEFSLLTPLALLFLGGFFFGIFLGLGGGGGTSLGVFNLTTICSWGCFSCSCFSRFIMGLVGAVCSCFSPPLFSIHFTFVFSKFQSCFVLLVLRPFLDVSCLPCSPWIFLSIV